MAILTSDKRRQRRAFGVNVVEIDIPYSFAPDFGVFGYGHFNRECALLIHNNITKTDILDKCSLSALIRASRGHGIGLAQIRQHNIYTRCALGHNTVRNSAVADNTVIRPCNANA